MGVPARGSALGLCSAICGLGYICGGSEPGGVATALSAAALLNGALLAHEAGHLAAARALGVAVREFSVGVGPRVAWWQGVNTTYSLRALPLFGYVSFLTASHLTQAATTPAAAAAIGGAAHLPYPASAAGATAAAAGRRPLLLLEWLPAGRRAVVVAAGVVANAILAGAFVAWQVMSYGELGVLVRQGAKIRRAEGWEGPEEAPAVAAAALQPQHDHHHHHHHHHQQQQQFEQQQQQQHSNLGLQQAERAPETLPERRLRAGDVVLRVGDRALPAGGDMEKVFVEALHAAAAAVAAAKTSVAVTLVKTRGGGGGDEGDGDVGENAVRATVDAIEAADLAVESLVGVQMMVLRGEGGSSSDGSGGGGRIVSVDATDVLRYETLAVSPNYVAGYKPPRDGWEAVSMLGRELASWMSLVLQSWSDALAAAVAGSSSGAGPSSSGNSDGGSHMVGPLGLVASAAAIAVAADREAHTVAAESSHRQQCATASSDHAMTAATTAVAAAGGAGPDNLQQQDHAAELICAGALCDSVGNVRHPPLLSMGIQVNLQLALINLLPLPVLDGGQLVLLALEAARGGRRLPPSLERAALVVSGLAVGCWVLALSLKDVVGLADTAAYRLAATLQPTTANRHNDRLTAAVGEGSMGTTSLAGRRRPAGHYASQTDLGADFDAAAAAGSWAT